MSVWQCVQVSSTGHRLLCGTRPMRGRVRIAQPKYDKLHTTVCIFGQGPIESEEIFKFLQPAYFGEV